MKASRQSVSPRQQLSMEQLHGCDPSPADINHGAKNSCWSGGWQWVVFAANILWKIPLVDCQWAEMVSLFTRTLDVASEYIILYYIIYKSVSTSSFLCVPPFLWAFVTCDCSLSFWLLFSVFQRNDIAMAITKFDQFDFLIDIVPRDDLKPPKRQVRKSEDLQAVKIDPFFFFLGIYEEKKVLCLAAWGRCKHPWLEAGCKVWEGFQSDVCSALLPLSLHNQTSYLFISSMFILWVYPYHHAPDSKNYHQSLGWKNSDQTFSFVQLK